MVCTCIITQQPLTTMKAKIEIPQDIITAIDYANTTNGGMSEPTLAVQQKEEGYEVKVKMAGVSADNFGLDVVNDRLWVYHFVDLFAERPEGLENLKTAHTIGNLFLPNDVNAEEIVARFDAQANVLKISIPFNQAKRNFRRHIDIEKW